MVIRIWEHELPRKREPRLLRRLAPLRAAVAGQS